MRSPTHRRAKAYTLIEVLILVVILGIAGALVVPSFSQTDALRIQGAVRTLVSDLTVAQSDAIAFQKGRAVVFNFETNSYTVVEVNGGTIDPDLDRITDQTIGGERFAWAAFTGSNFQDNTIIFDELGSPVVAPGSDEPAPPGYIEIANREQAYRVHVEAYTGRVTVESRPAPAPPANTETGSTP